MSISPKAQELLNTFFETDMVNYIKTTPLAQQRINWNHDSQLAVLPQESQLEEFTLAGIPTGKVSFGTAEVKQTVLLLHGGGYVNGSIVTHRKMATYISKYSASHVIIPDYRLAPEHPYPAGLDDAVTVYQELLAQGTNNKKLVIGGDSAGGGLALALALRLRDEELPLPAGIFLLSPWTDLTLSGEAIQSCVELEPILSPEDLKICAKKYYADTPAEHAYVSPLFADVSKLPPLLIQVGSDEILLSDSTRLAQKLKDAGSPVTLDVWQGMWHVWQQSAGDIPEADQAIQKLGEFIKKVCNV